MKNDPTLLVTGGCGFIGSAVCRMAVSRGLLVVNVDSLTYAANPANVAPVADSPLYSFEHADIRDAKAMTRIFEAYQPTAVMHLAAESHVDRSIDGPTAFVDTNVMGTATLLQAARAQWEATGKSDDFRFVHVSTDEVYGDLGPDDLAFSETTPYAPSSPYSASKAASDHLVRAWHRTFGLPILITNCSNNYGPYQFPEKLIPVVILNGLAGRPIPVYGEGTNRRDWLHVDDHADALLTVLEGGQAGRTYNIGGDNEQANIDLVHEICRQLDAHPGAPGTDHAALIEFVTDRPGHDRRYAIDASRMRDELNWTARTNGSDGLSATVDWYLSNREWWQALTDQAAQRLGQGTKTR